jgi:hypothetical protein
VLNCQALSSPQWYIDAELAQIILDW